MLYKQKILLLITKSSDLIEHIQKIAAAAGLEFTCLSQFPTDKKITDNVQALLVGAEIDTKFISRRQNVFLVSLETEMNISEITLYQKALHIGASDILILPNSDEWLTEHLSRTTDIFMNATTIGIASACGGAGASTLAMATAYRSAQKGHKTLLLDGDYSGGGLDVALGVENILGTRWLDLIAVRGYVGDTSLQHALPQVYKFALLSWDRRPINFDLDVGDKILKTIKIMRSIFEVIIIDIAAGQRLHSIIRDQIDHIFLIVPAKKRAIAAASQKISQFERPNTHIFLGGAIKNEISTKSCAAHLDATIIGEYKYSRFIKTDLSEGNLKLALTRNSLSKVAQIILQKSVEYGK